MKEVQYALIVRDDAGQQVAIVGTHREPLTKHRSVTPEFHKFCASILALRKEAVQIEVKPWSAGIDVDQAPCLVTVYRTDQEGWISFQVAETPRYSPDDK